MTAITFLESDINIINRIAQKDLTDAQTLRSAYCKQNREGLYGDGENWFTEDMTEDEIRLLFYASYLKEGISEDEADQKVNAAFSEYKKIKEIIDNPPPDVSELRIAKGGRIINKTGNFANINRLEDLKR